MITPNNDVGVMQGRLLPKYKGRYQAHPVGYWQDEFTIAAKLGVSVIEFIVDYDGYLNNPLIDFEGLKEVEKVVAVSGVSVKTVCADYFMEAPLHSLKLDQVKVSQSVLGTLIQNCARIGIKDIVIPCVDQSSIQGIEDKDRFVFRLTPLIDIARDHGIRLALETDLPAEEFSELLECFPLDVVTVNYDTGNSAAMGYCPAYELECYGDRITDIHIKDRKYQGGSVILGDGDVDFDGFFEELKKYDFEGPFILQAYRDEEGVGIFRQQIRWLQERYCCA